MNEGRLLRLIRSGVRGRDRCLSYDTGAKRRGEGDDRRLWDDDTTRGGWVGGGEREEGEKIIGVGLVFG